MLLITYIYFPCVVFNILVSFQFVLITFIYFSYLFPIWNLGPPSHQINAQDAYDFRFGRS
jgi:hypothetical protein